MSVADKKRSWDRTSANAAAATIRTAAATFRIRRQAQAFSFDSR